MKKGTTLEMYNRNTYGDRCLYTNISIRVDEHGVLQEIV